MAGLRRPFFLVAACVALMALPSTGTASDDSVSAADAPGGEGRATTSTWTTPPPGGRAAPVVRRTRPRRVTRRRPAPAPTPRWIEVPAKPAAADTATPTPTVVDDAPVVEAPPAVEAPPPAAQATPARPNTRRMNRRGVRGRMTRAARQPVQFRFAVGDEILISIWDDDVESGTIDLRQRILRDGTISPLWLDPIQAAGRTIAEVRSVLVEAYKEYYKIPRITVGVESVHLERAFVLGEVQEPSAITLNGPQTLLQVLAQAGGITPTLGAETVRVLRSRGPNRRPRIFTINTARQLRGRGGCSFMIMPGDVVYVHPSGLANWSRNLTTALAPIQAFFGATGGAAATYLAFDQIGDDN